jgi:pimeloyl-[acyl-carrier protein] methyl ester esterase
MKKVFIHGWGFSKNIWKDYFYLDDAEFLDLPFHGESKYQEATTLQSFAEKVSQHIKEPTTMIGWSLGASISVLTAMINPNVKKLVLVGFSPKFNDEKLGSSPSMIKAFMLNLKKDFENTVKNFRITAIGKDPSCGLPQKEGSYLLLKDFIELDLTDILHKIQCETYIIHGINDKIVNKEAAFFTHKAVKNSQLYILDSHHGPFLEKDITEFACQ